MAARHWVGGTANWDATAGTKWSLTNGGAGGQAVPTAADDVFFDSGSGANTVTITATANCKSLDTTGFTGTVTGSSALNVALSLNLTGGTWSYSGALTFNGTATGNTITSNGKTINGTLAFSGVGGGWTLADALTCASTITLTNGAFSAGGFNIQATAISVTGAAARSWDQTGSNVTLTGTGNVWNATTVTLLTLTTTSSIFKITNATATSKTFIGGAKTYNGLQFSGTGSGALSITGANTWTDTISISNTGGAGFSYSAVQTVAAMDFTGYTGTFSGAQGTVWTGSTWIWSGTMTDSYTGTITCDAATVQTITSSGHVWKQPFVISKTGGSVSLGDTFVSTNTFTVSIGTFTTNGQNLTCTRFVGSGTSIRSITIDNSIVTCTLAVTGDAWNLLTTTNLTFSATGSEIKITGATGTASIFMECGSLPYHFLTFTAAASHVGAGGYSLAGGSSSFDKIEYTGPGIQKIFFDGTQTINPGGRFVLKGDGTVGNWTVSADFTIATLKKTDGIMNEMDYLNVSFLFATGGALWFLGNHSTVNSSDGGWYATAAAA